MDELHSQLTPKTTWNMLGKIWKHFRGTLWTSESKLEVSGLVDQISGETWKSVITDVEPLFHQSWCFWSR